MNNYTFEKWELLGEIDTGTDTAVIAHENYPNIKQKFHSTIVAHVFRLSLDNEEFKKAVNIVKSAPKLLEMLKGVVADIEQNEQVSDDTFNSIKCLISKIEGDIGE